MLDSEFMRLAFGTGAVIGLLAPAVGFFLVQRNMSLVGDGVGHTAFAGVAAGYLLGVSPVLTALVAAVAGAVGIEWLRSRRRTVGDQALALLFYTGLAAGVVLASAAGALNVNLFAFLFGSILTVTREDLAIVALLGLGGLATVALLYRALVGVVVDEEGARVAGVPVAALNVLVAGLAGLTIGLSMQIVGHSSDRSAHGPAGDRLRAGCLEHALLDPPGHGDRPGLRVRRADDRVLRRPAAGRSDRSGRRRRLCRDEPCRCSPLLGGVSTRRMTRGGAIATPAGPALASRGALRARPARPAKRGPRVPAQGPRCGRAEFVEALRRVAANGTALDPEVVDSSSSGAARSTSSARTSARCSS